MRLTSLLLALPLAGVAASGPEDEADEVRFDLETIFVSVDPDRDTNERIEEYCKIFDKNMMGLTHKSNDNPELKETLKKFKIHVSKILLSEAEE